MKVLIFAASLRKGSFNKKLIAHTAALLKELGAEVDEADFADFNAPLYDGDIDGDTKPEGIMKFQARLRKNDALVISSPEYNFSMPGTLKNMVDWVSRLKPMPWTGQKILLLSASPSLVGGNRGLWSLRVPLEACGSFVYPDMFSLAKAHEAFNAAGGLADPANTERLRKNLKAFLDYVRKVTA